MSWKQRMYNRSMKCSTEGCENEVPPQARTGRPRRSCSLKCVRAKAQRDYMKRKTESIKKPISLGEVTQDILDSLGVDEKPDNHGNYRSSEVQAFTGGSDLSWGDHLQNLYETPIKSGRRI